LLIADLSDYTEKWLVPEIENLINTLTIDICHGQLKA
jgi:hypothetical protein